MWVRSRFCRRAKSFFRFSINERGLLQFIFVARESFQLFLRGSPYLLRCVIALCVKVFLFKKVPLRYTVTSLYCGCTISIDFWNLVRWTVQREEYLQNWISGNFFICRLIRTDEVKSLPIDSNQTFRLIYSVVFFIFLTEALLNLVELYCSVICII